MNDDVDADCPVCGCNAVCGDCRCDGGDQMHCGVERFVEFIEAGRARTGDGSASALDDGRRRPTRRELKAGRPSDEAGF